MNEIMLIIIGILGCIISFGISHRIPGVFLKEFKNGCYKSLKKKDNEFEEREKLNKELRKWFFSE